MLAKLCVVVPLEAAFMLSVPPLMYNALALEMMLLVGAPGAEKSSMRVPAWTPVTPV